MGLSLNLGLPWFLFRENRFYSFVGGGSERGVVCLSFRNDTLKESGWDPRWFSAGKSRWPRSEEIIEIILESRRRWYSEYEPLAQNVKQRVVYQKRHGRDGEGPENGGRETPRKRPRASITIQFTCQHSNSSLLDWRPPALLLPQRFDHVDRVRPKEGRCTSDAAGKKHGPHICEAGTL